MPKVSAVLPIVVCCGVLVGLVACDLLKMKIDKAKDEGLVGGILSKEQISATSVTCPDDQPATKGHSFECTAKVGEVDVHFRMEVLDDEGTVMATPRGHTLVVADVEDEIKADLQAKGRDVKTIDCHGDVWVAVKGAVATCDLTDEAGTAYLWTATFTDDTGNHTHVVAAK